jgi:cell division protein FtsL
MTRLNLLLLIAVLGSAIYLVHVQYMSRLLVTEMHRAELEARRLELEQDRLQVEKRAQATPLRVEKLAKDQLQMRTATPAITLYVRADGAVVPGAVAPAPIPVSAIAPRDPAAARTTRATRGER